MAHVHAEPQEASRHTVPPLVSEPHGKEAAFLLPELNILSRMSPVKGHASVEGSTSHIDTTSTVSPVSLG